MNTQITGYRISYFVFALFVSAIIVFTIHKSFQMQDIITIPLFAILLFLIIEFSVNSVYQNNVEKFLNEGFESNLLKRLNVQQEEQQEQQQPRQEQQEQQEEQPINSKKIITEEEHPNRHMMTEEEHHNRHMMTEEEHHNRHMMTEEEHPSNIPAKDKPSESKPSPTPNGDKKAKEATDKQEQRPDINKHLMDDGGKGLINRNLDTINPININVSYNNNRPYTVNDFNNPDTSLNSQLKMGKKPNDINRFRFDDGCEKKNTVVSGIDDNDLSNINQKYYPAYLENPLNKNQPAVIKNKNMESSNYEMSMMKRILNEQNDPSPVLLENPWSEWKPLDK